MRLCVCVFEGLGRNEVVIVNFPRPRNNVGVGASEWGEIFEDKTPIDGAFERDLSLSFL